MNEKKKHKIMLGIEVVLLCMIVAILGTNAASSNPPSNGVSYGKNNQTTVEGALNDLYTKANYGNATASQILKGQTALVGGKKVTGTLTIPTLASQTPGNATAKDITKGKVAWVNGNKIVGIGFEGKQKLSYLLKVGDYVYYIPEKTSYIISGEKTGYLEGKSVEHNYNDCTIMNYKDQFINPSELNSWRVIKINDDGTVEAVSANSQRIYLEDNGYYTRTSSGCSLTAPSMLYPNYVGVLNEIASSYETEGVTIDSRHMGYDGITPEYYEILNFKTNLNYPAEEGYKIDLELVNNAIGTLKVNNNENYCLASRGKISAGFLPYYYDYSADFGSVRSEQMSRSRRGIRPIVIFKSDAIVYGGVGTEESPWRLTN